MSQCKLLESIKEDMGVTSAELMQELLFKFEMSQFMYSVDLQGSYVDSNNAILFKVSSSERFLMEPDGSGAFDNRDGVEGGNC